MNKTLKKQLQQRFSNLNFISFTTVEKTSLTIAIKRTNTKEYRKEVNKQGDTLESHTDCFLHIAKNYKGIWNGFVYNEHGTLCDYDFDIEDSNILDILDLTLKQSCIIDEKSNEIILGSNSK